MKNFLVGLGLLVAMVSVPALAQEDFLRGEEIQPWDESKPCHVQCQQEYRKCAHLCVDFSGQCLRACQRAFNQCLWRCQRQ